MRPQQPQKHGKTSTKCSASHSTAAEVWNCKAVQAHIEPLTGFTSRVLCFLCLNKHPFGVRNPDAGSVRATHANLGTTRLAEEMSASISAERRKARPSLPGAPPKKSKSKKPSKPFVVASGVVSGVRTTAISGGTMFTASADAPLQWKGEWHFNNRVNHKHAFTYRTVGGTDLRAAAESCDLAWETVEPPATPSSEPRRPDSPAHSATSQGLPGVASEPAAAPAPAVGTPVSTPGGGAPAGSTTGSAASVEAPGALDWGVYVPPSRPAVSCPIPSGLVWLGEFFVPSMRSSTAEVRGPA